MTGESTTPEPRNSASERAAESGSEVAEALLDIAEAIARQLETAGVEQYHTGSGAQDWSAAGIAGHVSELLPYWASKLQAVAADPTLPLGRALDAPERLGAVVHGEELRPREAAAAVRAAAAEAAVRLRSIPDTAWTVSINRSGSDAMQLREAAFQLLVQHAQEHRDQIAATLAAARSG